MFDSRTVVVYVVAVLSVFLHHGIRAQPNIHSSTEGGGFCPPLEEEWTFQLEENVRLRGQLESERLKIKTLENVIIVQAAENRSLKRRFARIQLRKQRVTATYVASFDHSQYHHGITKVEDKIYVMNKSPNRIRVYADQIGFPFIKDIELRGTNFPCDIVYSSKSKCVYISDFNDLCIWEMTTTGDHRLTKWMSNVTFPNSLSLSVEGHLLMVRQVDAVNTTKNTVEMYSTLNATLIRKLRLPQDIKDPRHVVQTSTGKFIIGHRLTAGGPFLISRLSNGGQLIHRFTPRNDSEKINLPIHMALDSDNSRLFVADIYKNHVLLFDSSDLTWNKILLSKEMNGIRFPLRLFYDASKKHLFVAQPNGNITVYEMN